MCYIGNPKIHRMLKADVEYRRKVNYEYVKNKIPYDYKEFKRSQ